MTNADSEDVRALTCVRVFCACMYTCAFPLRCPTIVRIQSQGVIKTSRVKKEEKERRKMALDIVNFTIRDIKTFTLHVCV